MARQTSLLASAALLSAAFLAQPALADRSTADQAKALVQDAVTYLKANGAEKAAAAFNDPKGGFVRNDLYVFVFDDKGHYVASGGNPKLTGTDASGLQDAEGKPIVKDMLDATRTNPAGVVEYVWLNRASNKVEHKHSYLMREGSYLIGSGYYTD